MSAVKKRNKDMLLIRGYILPKKKVCKTDDEAEALEDSEEEQEEEKQPEFLDMGEMSSVSSGGQMFQSSTPLRNQVDFQMLSGETHKVEGRFALRSPWWEVTCSVRRQRNKLVLKGYPSYKLRSDLGREDWRGIISLFLAACSVEPTHTAQFLEWLPIDRDVTILNLMEVLGEFSEAGDGNVGPARSIAAGVSNSAEGMQVHASCLYPSVMKYLPTLLPGHFAELLGKGKRRKTLPATQATQTRQVKPANQQEEEEEEEDGEEGVDLTLLDKLEDIITNDVWKLGFKHLVYKELKLVRCEATFRAFVDCGLLQKIPLLQRNALWAYEELKNYCCRTGSTYWDQQGLCEDMCQESRMSDEQAWEAIQFLKDQGVVVCDKKKVMLQNFYFYETGIAKCLHSLVNGGSWKIPLNAREVLYAAEEERRRLKMQGTDSEQATTHPDENADSESNPDPTNISIPRLHGEELPLIKSEANTLAICESSDQQAGPAQAVADQVLPHIELDPDQVRAAEMICANPVTVISGKGGCGKTTVVSLLFKAMLEANQQEINNACMDFENDTGGSQSWQDPPGSPSFLPQSGEEEQEMITKRSEEILLTAPTGRAASLLTKRTGFTAYTLHQVLYSFMKAKKDQDCRPEEWKFQYVTVLVVDEGSLVCVQILHSILTMLSRYAKLRKFIILGDIRQLPSIQPGNILHDLYHGLNGVKWAIEMRTNHRAESQLIVKNAGLISEMGMRHWYGGLEFDATVDLNGSGMPSADKKFILVRLPSDESDDDLQKAIKLLIDSAPGLKEDSTSQFIAFKRVDVALINELCCKHYNGHITKDHKNKLVFQTGDKICCTKNAYVADEDQADGEREGFIPDSLTNDGQSQEQKKNQVKLRLCNGEIFFIREDKTVEEAGGSTSRRARRNRYLTLDDGDGRQFTVDYRVLQRECKLQHAWARTIHTFQGSENETIVYVLGNGSAQTWKHVYTAVTRGRKRVYVVAKKSGLVSAIKKRETPRNTRLESLVRGCCTGGQEPASQPDQSQSQPATPHTTSPGFRSQQSTPLSSQNPGRPRPPCSCSTPLLPRRLWKDEKVREDAADVSLMDDMVFSQAYSWSPMNSSEDHSTEQLVEVEEKQPNEETSKRVLSPEDMGTPRKQLRTEIYQSPLSCSPLHKLTLNSPQAQGKKLFKD